MAACIKVVKRAFLSYLQWGNTRKIIRSRMRDPAPDDDFMPADVGKLTPD